MKQKKKKEIRSKARSASASRINRANKKLKLLKIEMMTPERIQEKHELIKKIRTEKKLQMTLPLYKSRLWLRMVYDKLSFVHLYLQLQYL